ncbi:hypothetical protein V386_02699 [Staphylococcus aureus T28653]|nr:hypothetical protein V386_02699 [Staphylococcus aureus T28653]
MTRLLKIRLKTLLNYTIGVLAIALALIFILYL